MGIIESLIRDTLTEMGFSGGSALPYDITLSELPSWYELAKYLC